MANFIEFNGLKTFKQKLNEEPPYIGDNGNWFVDGEDTGVKAEGPIGPIGATGKQGPTGTAGSQGKQGPTGSVGSQGKQGPTGAAGNQGKQGPTGASGSNGKQGPTGANGSAGKQGPTGATGSQGKQGPTGASGTAASLSVTGSGNAITDISLDNTTKAIIATKGNSFLPLSGGAMNKKAYIYMYNIDNSLTTDIEEGKIALKHNSFGDSAIHITNNDSYDYSSADIYSNGFVANYVSDGNYKMSALYNEFSLKDFSANSGVVIYPDGSIELYEDGSPNTTINHDSIELYKDTNTHTNIEPGSIKVNGNEVLTKEGGILNSDISLILPSNGGISSFIALRDNEDSNYHTEIFPAYIETDGIQTNKLYGRDGDIITVGCGMNIKYAGALTVKGVQVATLDDIKSGGGAVSGDYLPLDGGFMNNNAFISFNGENSDTGIQMWSTENLSTNSHWYPSSMEFYNENYKTKFYADKIAMDNGQTDAVDKQETIIQPGYFCNSAKDSDGSYHNGIIITNELDCGIFYGTPNSGGGYSSCSFEAEVEFWQPTLFKSNAVFEDSNVSIENGKLTIDNGDYITTISSGSISVGDSEAGSVTAAFICTNGLYGEDASKPLYISSDSNVQISSDLNKLYLYGYDGGYLKFGKDSFSAASNCFASFNSSKHINTLTNCSSMFVCGGENKISSMTAGGMVIGNKNTITNTSEVVVIGNTNVLGTAGFTRGLIAGYGNEAYDASTYISNAFACGYGLLYASNSFAIGHFNSVMNLVGSTSGTGTGIAFTIGNGTSSVSCNAFFVNYNGETYAEGAYSNTGADYAEYIEWQDGNIEEKDRVGLFVTLDEDKMKIANEGDFIIGAVSATPSIIGNSACMHWNDQYLKDDFGRYLYENVEVTDEEGNISTKKERILNPCYNPTETYIPREDRAEWAPVGMLGFLRVYDDGTCVPNSYCKCGANGIATKAGIEENSFLTPIFRVTKRIASNIIEIYFK